MSLSFEPGVFLNLEHNVQVSSPETRLLVGLALEHYLLTMSHTRLN